MQDEEVHEEDNSQKLKELEGEDARSVVPLDIYLGIDKLPFKVSGPLMEEICFFAIRSSSYQEAEDEIRRIYGLHISDDTMRKIVNWAGKIVFDADCREAAEKLLTLENGSFKTPRDLDGVLYLETDGAALLTRLKNEDGSVWRENKLGIAFTSDTLIKWRSRKDGQARCRIGRREYVSFIRCGGRFQTAFFRPGSKERLRSLQGDSADKRRCHMDQESQGDDIPGCSADSGSVSPQGKRRQVCYVRFQIGSQEGG